MRGNSLNACLTNWLVSSLSRAFLPLKTVVLMKLRESIHFEPFTSVATMFELNRSP